MEALEALRRRLSIVPDPEHDPLARRLMAQVALAKSTSFIALLQTDGRVIDVTAAPLTAGGVNRAEVIGRPLWETAWWRACPASRRELEQAVTAAAEGRFSRFDADVLIEGGGTASGTLDFSLRPLRAGDGRIALIVAEGRPITDRKRAEERIAAQHSELTALTARLSQIHDYRERLLGELSHDLRAPLQVVLAREERIRRQSGDTETRKGLQGIRLAALDALEQVDGMLEQVRRDHSATQARARRLRPGARRAHGRRQFEPLRRRARGALHGRGARGAAGALRRRARQPRGLQPARERAAEHPPVRGTVRCTLVRDGDDARLEVADSGIGVPPDERDRLFERFRTLSNGSRRLVGAASGSRSCTSSWRCTAARSRSTARRRAVRCSRSASPLARRRRGGRGPRWPSSSRRCAAASTCANRWSPAGGRGAGAGRRAAAGADRRRRRRALRGARRGGGAPRAARATADAAEALRLAADLRPDLVVLGPSSGTPAGRTPGRDPRSGGAGGRGRRRRVRERRRRARLLAAGAIDVISPDVAPDELFAGACGSCSSTPRCGAGSTRRETALGRAAGAAGNPTEHHRHRHRGRRYSTVTVLARLRGWSTFRPRWRAIAVGQQLQRDDGEDRLQHPVGGRHARSPHRRAARDRPVALGGDRDHVRAAGARPPACSRRPCRAPASRSRRTTTGVRLVEQRDRPVLHLAGRVGVGGDVGDLLELERALERDREPDVAAEVEEEVAPPWCSAIGRPRPRRSRVEHLVDAVRQALELGHQLRDAPRGSACRAARPGAARAGT